MQSLKIKQEEAPPVACNNRRGHQLSAIDCDKPFNLIVGQLRERSNAYNDLPRANASKFLTKASKWIKVSLTFHNNL